MFITLRSQVNAKGQCRPEVKEDSHISSISQSEKWILSHCALLHCQSIKFSFFLSSVSACNNCVDLLVALECELTLKVIVTEKLLPFWKKLSRTKFLKYGLYFIMNLTLCAEVFYILPSRGLTYLLLFLVTSILNALNIHTNHRTILKRMWCNNILRTL